MTNQYRWPAKRPKSNRWKCANSAWTHLCWACEFSLLLESTELNRTHSENRIDDNNDENNWTITNASGATKEKQPRIVWKKLKHKESKHVPSCITSVHLANSQTWWKYLEKSVIFVLYSQSNPIYSPDQFFIFQFSTVKHFHRFWKENLKEYCSNYCTHSRKKQQQQQFWLIKNAHTNQPLRQNGRFIILLFLCSFFYWSS